MVVGDEAALKQVWSVKGASGTMLCMQCRTVVASASDLDTHASAGSLLAQLHHRLSGRCGAHGWINPSQCSVLGSPEATRVQGSL